MPALQFENAEDGHCSRLARGAGCQHGRFVLNTACPISHVRECFEVAYLVGRRPNRSGEHHHIPSTSCGLGFYVPWNAIELRASDGEHGANDFLTGRAA
jgi:hypothetical protein